MVKKIIKDLLGIPDPQLASNAANLNEQNRIAWLEKTLKDLPAGGRILDAGAGELQFKRFCSHLKYVSQDFGKYNPQELKTGLQMQSWEYGKLDHECDIAAIPEKDAAFDAVMCTEVFEHIIHPRDAISEFSRLLKPGGYLVITAPFCSLTHFAPYHFYTGFSRYFYESELAQKEFDIIEISPNGNYFDYLAQELTRVAGMSEKYAGRPLTKSELKATDKLLRALLDSSRKDAGSHQLLCFGYHVLARKKQVQQQKK